MPEAQAQEEAGGKSLIRTGIQSIGIFFLIQFAAKQLLPQPQAADPAQGGSAVAGTSKVNIPAYADRPHQLNSDAVYNAIPQTLSPMWPLGTEIDINMYISPSIAMPALKSMPKESLLLDEKKFKFGDYNDNRVVETNFAVPKAAQKNATIFGHFYVGKSGAVLDPTAPGYDPAKAYRFVWPLTRFMPKKKTAKTRNLLSDMPERDMETEEEKKAPKVIASYYHPNLTISMIPDSGVVNYPVLHPGPRQFFQPEATGSRDATGQHGWYYPVLFPNTFWQLKKDFIELNETVKTLPFNVQLNNLANWKFNLYASMEENIRAQQQAAAAGHTTPTGSDGSEMEMFKEIIVDSNMYLLGLTGIVSILHMIFEAMAFKNDVAHWRKKKDNVGTSVRTILANVIMQSIIFLYLLDNNENTSWMILFGQGTGIAIEAWKITKTVNVRVRHAPPGSWLPYTVTFEDKHPLSDTEKKTEEYDAIAFKYMYLLAIPLLVAYAIYSLMYDSHKSWYSFVITTLVGSVYAYGFLMMVPSLYINYRLKSVAHMPGRAMMYKFLNTFIDDLFAFTIKMPTLHRLATLRDDVIFFVYLYQTWVYKVDYKRVNEFGQGGDEDEAVEEKKEKGEGEKEREGKSLPKVPEQVVGEGKKGKATGVERPGAMRRGK
ncbi:cleft lip and palate transmembrane 1 [Sporormia fimetaria CBS 119925]|uniref:Cleft lip and palate transmembrane 1 n=1 Tax=Sporormia fimetaria CBS 119925 TaxID=1340428 RepID=A0A6A6V3P4_9PLEO|nr:cleft lip and palate transmembrane 1 [Sporormia fimetaria CBS 119925]